MPTIRQIVQKTKDAARRESRDALSVGIKTLSVRGVKQALANSGYGDPDDEIKAARFLREGGTPGVAVYEISYVGDEGSIDFGKVYIEEKNGRFYGEY